jgi:hypothetical protein
MKHKNSPKIVLTGKSWKDQEMDTGDFQTSLISQEWTPEYVLHLIKGYCHEDASINVADAHNAALAAEREKRLEVETQLQAWQQSFGTTQLTHALAKKGK